MKTIYQWLILNIITVFLNFFGIQCADLITQPHKFMHLKILQKKSKYWERESATIFQMIHGHKTCILFDTVWPCWKNCITGVAKFSDIITFILPFFHFQRLLLFEIWEQNESSLPFILFQWASAKVFAICIRTIPYWDMPIAKFYE